MEGTIETAALGRPFQLGMLYDCRKDVLVPGITLWDREQLQQNIAVRPDISTEFTITTSDTIEEKSKNLKVDGELKLSLLAGNVELSGAARYFNDTKKSFKQERLMLHYRSSTKFEHLTMNHLAHAKMGHHKVFDYDIATHVVTAVRYGADAYFVFDREVNEFEKEISKGGEGRINLEQLKKVFVSGDAQINIHVNEEEKGELNKLSCTFHGDFKLPSNPATFEDAMKVYTDLPKLIGEDGEHAVPVKVWLFPLVKLDSSAGKLQRFINTDLIRAVESVFEALNVTDMKCYDLLQDTVIKTFSTFHNQVQTAQKFCSEYKQDFMRKLAVLLPEIRGGKTDIKHLTELLDAHEKSPFNACDLQQWITVKEKKSIQLKALLKQLCDLGAEMTDDIDTQLLDLNVENLVAYAFTCLQHQDPFLTKQKIYLNPLKVETLSENTLDSSCQEKSWSSVELACMRNNLKMFSDLIALNKSQTTKFIVQSVAQTSSASCILLYENGSNETVCFYPPSKPTSPIIESVTDDSITVQLSPSCSATLERNLLYKMKQEKNWKTHPANQDSLTLHHLQQDTAYEIKYEALGKLNYTVESDVTTATTTRAVVKSQMKLETSKSELTQEVVATKPAFLVGHHHIFDPDYVDPDWCVHVVKRTQVQPREPSANLNNQKTTEFGHANDMMRAHIKQLENLKKKILKKEEKVFTSNEVIIAAELKLVLLGRTGYEKTAAKNIILGKDMPDTSAPTSTMETENTQLVAGRKVTVVDTPDWFSPGSSLEEFRQTVGPQAFLLILPVRNSEETEHKEDKTQVSFLKMGEIFGESCWRNTMIIFSVTDELQKKNIEQFIQSGDQELQELVKKCENRFHCLSIKESGDGSQVSELLEKIEMMVDRNGTKVYQIIRDMVRETALLKNVQHQMQKSLDKNEQYIKQCKDDLRDLGPGQNSADHRKMIVLLKKKCEVKIDAGEEIKKRYDRIVRMDENRQFIRVILPETMQTVWLSLSDEQNRNLDKKNELDELKEWFSTMVHKLPSNKAETDERDDFYCHLENVLKYWDRDDLHEK